MWPVPPDQVVDEAGAPHGRGPRPWRTPMEPPGEQAVNLGSQAVHTIAFMDRLAKSRTNRSRRSGDRPCGAYHAGAGARAQDGPLRSSWGGVAEASLFHVPNRTRVS